MELLAIIGFVALIICMYYFIEEARKSVDTINRGANYCFSILILFVIIGCSVYLGKTIF